MRRLSHFSEEKASRFNDREKYRPIYPQIICHAWAEERRERGREGREDPTALKKRQDGALLGGALCKGHILQFVLAQYTAEVSAQIWLTHFKANNSTALHNDSKGSALKKGLQNYSLECLNDYLFTITCVLTVSSDLLPHGATSWLEFYDYREPYRCVLTAQAHSWVCELDLTLLVDYTFTDADFFQISLNSSYHGNSSSAVLEEIYKPVKHSFIQHFR
ncbi:hypothetical protein AOLI_G00045300 [Acnodon oligacanthus]